MMMKNIRCILLAALLISLAGLCFAETAPAMEPPVFTWERDAAFHWQRSGDGGRINEDPHTLEDVVCSVCGSEIYLYDDGAADLYDYNEAGDMTRCSSYDGQGVLTSETVFAYVYHENGAKLKEYEFCEGVLIRELLYTVTGEGESLPLRQTAWYDDGTWAMDEYDAHGNLVRAYVYDADGTISVETESTYALNPDGWYYEASNMIRMEGATFYSEFNAYGDETRTVNTDENGVVWADIRREYGYEDGVQLWCKRYEQDRLTTESVYGEWGGVETETEYLEDGSRIVCTYDGNGDCITTVFLNADGSVAREESCEYIYDDEMTLLAVLTRVGGVLTVETTYAADAEGWPYKAEDVLYQADGSRTVTTYDPDGEIISVVEHAAAAPEAE